MTRNLLWLPALLVFGCGTMTMTPAMLNHAVGQSCKTNADCATGLTCSAGDPGGQCQKSCPVGNDAACGDPTLVCANGGTCYPKCTNPTGNDCTRKAEGYLCKTDTTRTPAVDYCDAP